MNTNIRAFCDLLSCGSLGPRPLSGYKLDKGLTLMEVLIFFFEKLKTYRQAPSNNFLEIGSGQDYIKSFSIQNEWEDLVLSSNIRTICRFILSEIWSWKTFLFYLRAAPDIMSILCLSLCVCVCNIFSQVGFWCCKKEIWSIHWVEDEDDLNNEDNLKNEDDLKNCSFPPNFFAHPWHFFMTSHLGSHGTNDMKPEMLPGVQTGNGIQHVEYNIRGFAHVHAYRKDNI